jgi:hypothetical protein
MLPVTRQVKTRVLAQVYSALGDECLLPALLMEAVMKIDENRNMHCLILLVGTMLVVAGVAQASVRVGGESLRANGQVAQGFQYTGGCPVALKFEWGLIATEPTTVTYSFVRSDENHSSRSSAVELPAANRSVPIYVDWRLGANTPEFANYRGWVQLNIESPNAVSQKISFTIHCAPAAGSATEGKESASGGEVHQSLHVNIPAPAGSMTAGKEAAGSGAAATGQEPATGPFPADATISVVKSQGTALPLKRAEQIAFIFVESINDLEENCGRHAAEPCTLDVLVSGPKWKDDGSSWDERGKLKYDPNATDQNYSYKVALKDGGWQIWANPRIPGLCGIYVDGGFISRRYYNPAGPATENDKQIDFIGSFTPFIAR